MQMTPKKLCIIGDPVTHSRSPLIQNAMISALDLPYLYLHQPVAAGELEAWLATAKAEGYAGFNATMPHKQALVPLMDELGESAARCGAVNTVCIKSGKLYGYNTDGAGFAAALRAIGCDPFGKCITLTGAGGAALAVGLALAGAGAARIRVCNRSAAPARTLCERAPDVMEPMGLALSDLLAAAEGCDLLVNCTSLGMHGGGGQFESLAFVDALPAHAVVCDLIYNPPETPLLAYARERGHVTMNGLPMLMHQAILALGLFVGMELDAAAMMAVLGKTLG